MSTVSAFEAKTRFGEILDRVSKGEEIVITRHDKPVARIIPEGGPRIDEVRQAVAELRSLREGMAKRPGFRAITDREIRDAIRLGRR